jgi:glycosyltransferase involved in cell wall biosynthesis
MPPDPVPVLLLVREPHYGGCERDMARLAIHMDRTRFTPHVGCFRPEGLQRPAIEAAGVPIVHFDVPSFKSWAAVRAVGALDEYVRKHRIAVVHPFDVPTAIWAVPAARWAGVPLIVSSQLSYRSLDFYPPAHLRALRLGDRWAHHWMVNSRAVFEHLVKDEGLPAERISIHYNGVDSTLFYPGPSRTDGPVTIGTVAVLRPEKKIETLLMAFARMREPARLVIVGDGPERARLQALAAELGLGAERCQFEAATNDAGKWFRSFDLFCLPSANESFPNSLLEAMACGCVVAGSAVGGVPELIEDGENGVLFQPGDIEALANHLDRFSKNREERVRMSAAAATKAAEYTVARYCRGIENMYTTHLPA